MANEQLTPEMQLTMLLAQYQDLKIIRDILIPSEEGKTMHIDFLILTRAGIFVCHHPGGDLLLTAAVLRQDAIDVKIVAQVRHRYGL